MSAMNFLVPGMSRSVLVSLDAPLLLTSHDLRFRGYACCLIEPSLDVARHYAYKARRKSSDPQSTRADFRFQKSWTTTEPLAQLGLRSRF
jgi:hypothetical protein